MLFTDSVFVGIDPASSHKSFVYAALDRGLNLVSLADAELEDILAFLGGQESATVAINAPSGVNHGLAREMLKKNSLTPHQIRGAGLRMAEHELRERGIAVSGTPANAAMCPAWVQSGFELYRKLMKMGFVHYPQTDAAHQILETHPHACYCALAGQAVLPKPSLEGRMQRQLLLHERGVRVKDPMDFFEEITRYKLTRGIWPMELLCLPEQLDALAAAFTAWMAINKPNEITSIGDTSEGAIVLPVKELKEKY